MPGELLDNHGRGDASWSLPSIHPEGRKFGLIALGNAMVLGLVVGIHIDDSILTDGMVDMTKFKPLARLGYQDYSVTHNFYTMPFPKPEPVEEPAEPVDA